jgi:hypothetical protein
MDMPRGLSEAELSELDQEACVHGPGACKCGSADECGRCKSPAFELIPNEHGLFWLEIRGGVPYLETDTRNGFDIYGLIYTQRYGPICLKIVWCEDGDEPFLGADTVLFSFDGGNSDFAHVFLMPAAGTDWECAATDAEYRCARAACVVAACMAHSLPGARAARKARLNPPPARCAQAAAQQAVQPGARPPRCCRRAGA